MSVEDLEDYLEREPNLTKMCGFITSVMLADPAFARHLLHELSGEEVAPIMRYAVVSGYEELYGLPPAYAELAEELYR